MKKLISLFSLILCCCILLTACGGSGKKGGEKAFVVPNDLMTEEEYRAEIDALLKYDTISTADDAYLAKIDDLTRRLEDMIRYNTEIPECTGTTYYVSNSGNDENDGKTPETAWATLEKVNSYIFGKGDMVLFERGGVWRGHLYAKSDMTYSAYGEGHKPTIMNSIDGKTYGKWVQTDKENVWKLDEKIYITDIGVIVFNGYDNEAAYAEKVTKESQLDKNHEFIFKGSYCEEGTIDNQLYLVCEEGNPAEVFEQIEISLSEDAIECEGYLKNVHFNNLELLFGSTPYSVGYANNIRMSYCVAGWQGGITQGRGGARFCGGVGVLPDGDNITTDHCYFYQQFDSGVTPQVAWSTMDKGGPAIFENFITTDCLFEPCEYTLEYFNTQNDTTENCFKGMYFGYNLCREGGAGVGDKAGASAYIKSWSHENTCYDCVFENNVFDRAVSWSVEVISYKQNADGSKELSYELMPTLRNNIYIQTENKRFANFNTVQYRFKESDINKIQALGIDKGSVYMIAPKTETEE